MLPNDKKQMIAGELDRSVREIERKVSVSHLLFRTVQPLELTYVVGYENSGSLLDIPIDEQAKEPGESFSAINIDAYL